MKKRVLSLIMVLCMAMCSGLNVVVAEEVTAEEVTGIQSRASAVINNCSISISSNSGTIYVGAMIAGVVRCDKIGISSVRIQEKQNGKWVTVKSASSKYSYDSYSRTYTLTYSGTVGKEYRATASFYAKDGDIYDTESLTSSTITNK